MTLDAGFSGRLLVVLLAALAAVGAFLLSERIAALGLWSPATASIAGRAMLGAAGLADPSILLAAYPPIPYLVLLGTVYLTAPIGLHAVSVASAIMAAGFVAAYAITLRRARYGTFAVLLLVALLCLNPLAIESVARGPEGMMLIWGVWLYGLGLFGLRATAGVNDVLTLSLSLPILALSSVQGLVIALCALPFLLLAVPPRLTQRAYGSVYIVLGFPLLFAAVSMMGLNAIMMHDPFAFVTPELLIPADWSPLSQMAAVAAAMLAATGALVIALGLIVRTRARRLLQDPTIALLGTMLLSVLVLGVFGLADSAIDALAPIAAAAALIAARWPIEPARLVRVGSLLAICLMVAALVVAGDRVDRPGIGEAALLGDTAASPDPDTTLGMFLTSHDDVTIDAAAHPVVVSARGRADGLVTARSPVFGVSMRAQRVFTRHVAVRAHRPGISADAVALNFPDLYDGGQPGYRLAFDRGGWRVWSRTGEEG